MTQRFGSGDRVRVDIPDETDPDHDEFHGRHGAVVAVFKHNVPAETGDERDAHIYRVALDDGGTADFRWRDLRPPLDK